MYANDCYSIVSVWLAMHQPFEVNLNEYKSCMLASLRSLLPKDWDSAHEVSDFFFTSSHVLLTEKRLNLPSATNPIWGQLFWFGLGWCGQFWCILWGGSEILFRSLGASEILVRIWGLDLPRSARLQSPKTSARSGGRPGGRLRARFIGAKKRMYT